VPNQRQTAVGCDNLGVGLFELEGAHSHGKKSLPG
jgi:hypothetical protein